MLEYLSITDMGYLSLLISYFTRYKVQYTNKGEEVTKEIAKTDKDKKIELPNLEPASTYSVKSTVVLPDEYGGNGDPVVSTVYTGQLYFNLFLPVHLSSKNLCFILLPKKVTNSLKRFCSICSSQLIREYNFSTVVT